MNKKWDLSGKRYVITPLWGHPSTKWIAEGLQRRGAVVEEKDQILETLKTSLKPSHVYSGIILPSTERREENQWLATLLGCPMLSELDLAQDIVPCPMIAVTGTNGKTSTCEMIADGLRAAGHNIELFVNFEDSVCNLKDPKTDFAVVECWSSQLEPSRAFAPHIAVFLNLEPNHLDHHPDFNAYAEVKSRIFALQTENDWLIYNSHSAELMICIKRLAAKESQRLDFTTLREDMRLAPTTLGAHFRDNQCAALAVAAALRLDVGKIQRFVESLATFKSRPHRQQILPSRDGITYVNDSKSTTPHSLRASLERFTVSRPLVLITGGTDKNLPLEEVVDFMKGKFDALVLLGSFPRLEALLKERGIAFDKQPSLPEALACARNKLKKDGTILFSPLGASGDLFADYEERGRHFIEAVEALTRIS